MSNLFTLPECQNTYGKYATLVMVLKNEVHGDNSAFACVHNGEIGSSSSFQKRDSFKTPSNPFSDLFIVPVVGIMFLFYFDQFHRGASERNWVEGVCEV